MKLTSFIPNDQEREKANIFITNFVEQSFPQSTYGTSFDYLHSDLTDLLVFAYFHIRTY